jgi:hypothetical protein
MTSSQEKLDKITDEMLFSKINIPDITQKSGLPFKYLISENEDFNKLIECPICLKILIDQKHVGNVQNHFVKIV